MKLVNPTDDQLEKFFAEHVAGWKRHTEIYWLNERHEIMKPNFTKSADAVLPYLNSEKNHWRAETFWIDKKHHGPDGLNVFISKPDSVGIYSRWHRGYGKTFPMAACIALLDIHGVEVSFT